MRVYNFENLKRCYPADPEARQKQGVWWGLRDTKHSVRYLAK